MNDGRTSEGSAGLKSYSSATRGPRAFVREVRNLRTTYSGDADAEARALVGRLTEVERLVAERFGLDLRGLRMLDVGAGQRLLQMKYFSGANTVVGIDLDVIAQGFDPAAYLRMLRVNGVKRTAKTVGRKLLGVDARQSRALRQVLRCDRFPTLDVRHMSADQMTFPDASFDFVYAMVVFQHLADPESVAGEMARVLAPGGVAYADFILYTSPTGAHDIRLLGGRSADLPRWAHLRPGYRDLVQPSAYVNGLRLPDWRGLFERQMPGAELLLVQPGGESLSHEAAALKRRGELEDYALEELVTTKVITLWRKPA